MIISVHMPKRTRAELENRLLEMEGEMKALRQEFKDLSARGREVLKKGKGRRDEGLLAAVRRQLGL